MPPHRTIFANTFPGKACPPRPYFHVQKQSWLLFSSPVISNSLEDTLFLEYVQIDHGVVSTTPALWCFVFPSSICARDLP